MSFLETFESEDRKPRKSAFFISRIAKERVLSLTCFSMDGWKDWDA